MTEKYRNVYDVLTTIGVDVCENSIVFRTLLNRKIFPTRMRSGETTGRISGVLNGGSESFRWA